MRSLLVEEYLVDLQLEQTREAEGYGEARIELPSLDRVDRLPGNARALCHVGLRPGVFGPEIRDAVSARCWPRQSEASGGGPFRNPGPHAIAAPGSPARLISPAADPR